MIRRGVVAGLLAAALMAGAGLAADPPNAATKPAAAAKPKTEIKLDSPSEALETYFMAWKNGEYKAIMECIAVTSGDAKWTKITENYVMYNMWRLALERACVTKFGKAEGIKVFTHARSVDDQLLLDLKRLTNATPDPDRLNRDVVKILLRIERDRPEGLLIDGDFFRDEWWLIRHNGKWKIDYLKTFKLTEDENAASYSGTIAFPRIATGIKQIVADVKAGKHHTADAVKSAVQNEWEKLPASEPPKE